MKVLYAGALTPNDTALHRLWALERLGARVVPFSSRGYESSNAILRKVFFRLSAGSGVERLNVDLLQVAAAERPDVFWADKMLWIKPETLLKLRAMGILTVSYMIDNPFGTRQDPGWRLYRKDIQFYDLHVVQRETNIRDYKSRGARDVIKIQTAYEPTLHFPPNRNGATRIVTGRFRSLALLTMTEQRRSRVFGGKQDSPCQSLAVRGFGSERLARRRLRPFIEAKMSFTGRHIERLSGGRRSTSAFLPIPIKMSSRTRALRLPVAVDSCWRSARTGIRSGLSKTKRQCSSRGTRSWSRRSNDIYRTKWGGEESRLLDGLEPKGMVTITIARWDWW